MKENIYVKCPEYETLSFHLRLVEISDAKDLLKCYSDKTAVEKINADNCTSDFYYQTIEEMQQCIKFWLDEYKNKHFVRFAIVEKKTQKAIGTVEIFGGKYGVLRIDIATEFEQPKYVEEILSLAIHNFISDFGIETLEIKTSNTPKRLPLIEKYGFVPSDLFRPGFGYYERKHKTYFCGEKGVGYCGLACCVCSENEDCPGCRSGGCKDKNWCKSYNCCTEKGLHGCWECSEFPCQNPMLNKIRVRTFAEFIKEYGEEKLIECLKQNEINGMFYHYTGKLIGDYDIPSTEEEIKNLILYGNH